MAYSFPRGVTTRILRENEKEVKYPNSFMDLLSKNLSEVKMKI